MLRNDGTLAFVMRLFLDRIDSEILVNRLGLAPEMCNPIDEFRKHPRKGVYSEQNSLLIQ